MTKEQLDRATNVVYRAHQAALVVYRGVMIARLEQGWTHECDTRRGYPTVYGARMAAERCERRGWRMRARRVLS